MKRTTTIDIIEKLCYYAYARKNEAGDFKPDYKQKEVEFKVTIESTEKNGVNIVKATILSNGEEVISKQLNVYESGDDFEQVENFKQVIALRLLNEIFYNGLNFISASTMKNWNREYKEGVTDVNTL